MLIGRKDGPRRRAYRSFDCDDALAVEERACSSQTVTAQSKKVWR